MAHSPEFYGLQHDGWRPGQQEMIEGTYNATTRDKRKFVIVSAPTGSGKTTLPRALAATGGRVLALVKTKELQANNYGDGYGFTVAYGRDNYACVHPKAKLGETASTCRHTQKMSECEAYGNCGYAIARNMAMRSPLTALNYAYWLQSRTKWEPVRWLVCDEAHQIPDIVIEWAGVTVTQEDVKKFNLPMLPMISPYDRPLNFESGNTRTKEDKALAWLDTALKAITEEQARRRNQILIEAADLKVGYQLENFKKKLEATRIALQSNRDFWFIHSGPQVGQLRDGTKQFALVVKPLTARQFFKSYLSEESEHTILMSATIGNAATFAEELGLTDYLFHQVPSSWPAASRPVHVLDVPLLGTKAPESAWIKQAQSIAKALNDCPGDWSGIIHVTSKMRARDLATRLNLMQKRHIFVASAVGGTEKQVADWSRFRDQHPGAINVSWALHEGYDGTEEKICIIAKVPFPDTSSEYEKARMTFNGHFYQQRTAWALEQMAGRTRRGRAEDYDTSSEKRGLVAIADGRWRSPQKYYSPHFLESIVEDKR